MRKQILKRDICRDLYGDKKRTKGGIIIQWAMKESFSFQCDISDPTCNSLVKYSTLMGLWQMCTQGRKKHVLLQYKTTQRNVCSAWKKLLWKQFLEMNEAKFPCCNLTHTINLSGVIVLFAINQHGWTRVFGSGCNQPYDFHTHVILFLYIMCPFSWKSFILPPLCQKVNRDRPGDIFKPW